MTLYASMGWPDAVAVVAVCAMALGFFWFSTRDES